MNTRWCFCRIDTSAAEGLESTLGISAPAARVLCARGISTPAAARQFLSPRTEDLHDPSLLTGMRPALERIRRAVETREKILIYGDYDVDGAVSVAILKKAIEMAGGVAEFYVPDRLKDGYGMRPEVVERAACDGVSLLISVDTGIRAAEVVRRAGELGIDVIITDHHLPEVELPAALAVLNPNQPQCGYPEKNLCGAGVAFKLVHGIFCSLGWPPVRLQKVLASFLKMVALATVADVVPLTGENRIIVRHGLSGLGSVRSPGLRAILNVSGFSDGRVPSAGDVAFRIAPRLNAAGRMATANDVIELFLTGDPDRAQTLAERLHAWNTERQQTEAGIVRSILACCERTPVPDTDCALVFCGEGWHRGVLGIVATRILERFNRPVCVLSCDPETGLAQGSGRSIARFHLLDALESMPDLFVKFGGHRHAAGMTLEASRVDEFRSRLNRYATARLTPADFAPEIEIDSTISLPEVNDRSVADILSVAPFGFGNPAPVLAVMGAELAAPPAILKEKHARLVLRQQGRTLPVVAWNYAKEAAGLNAGDRVDAAIAFEEDARGASLGYAAWRARLRELRPSCDDKSPHDQP